MAPAGVKTIADVVFRIAEMLDVTGYKVKGHFYARQVCLTNMYSGASRVWHCAIPVDDMTTEDRQSAVRVFRLTGIPAEPRSSMVVVTPYADVVRELREVLAASGCVATDDDTWTPSAVVGYKGGLAEYDLLVQLDAFRVNIETVPRCPSGSTLLDRYATADLLTRPCAECATGDRRSMQHCPIVKTRMWRDWLSNILGGGDDTAARSIDDGDIDRSIHVCHR